MKEGESVQFVEEEDKQECMGEIMRIQGRGKEKVVIRIGIRRKRNPSMDELMK